MKEFIKEWGRVCLGSVAAAGLGATSFFAVEALMPQPADAKLDKEFPKGLESALQLERFSYPTKRVIATASSLLKSSMK